MPVTSSPNDYRRDRKVALVSGLEGYGSISSPYAAPELPSRSVETTSLHAVRTLLRLLRLDESRHDTQSWNPLGDWIAPGSCVVVKPNLVHHINQSGAGLECLVTHSALIGAVLEYVFLTEPTRVIVGDAPIQGCDFDELTTSTGLASLVERYRAAGRPIDLMDFRRQTAMGDGGHRLCDLGDDSWLAPVTNAEHDFRVTMYDPRALAASHGPGRHQYLIAKPILEADAVISMPKLKTHRKAGVTGSLKNLVGINASKAYLPHHRRGSPAANGGDCYPVRSWWKERAEATLDLANRPRTPGLQAPLRYLAQGLLRAGSRFDGTDLDIEGGWHGNDTVWRMCLDLQRIVRYADRSGVVRERPQRQVISITDAIVAGEGEGPLASVPAAAGFATASRNQAAAEWVHSLLMGFEPASIPLVRNSFATAGYYSVGSYKPEEISILTAQGTQTLHDLRPALGRPFLAPIGWKGHCEMPEAMPECSRR